jgi:putative membrane protein
MRPKLFLGLCAVAVLTASAAQAKAPREFLQTALEGDNSEVALGRLAQERGASREVREFGRMLEQDHGQARDQAVAVAGRMGVRPTSAMMPEARAEAAKLRRLSGDRFDREFARYMVQDHRKDIREFEQQAQVGGPTGQLARQALPSLRRHLDMAQRLSNR